METVVAYDDYTDYRAGAGERIRPDVVRLMDDLRAWWDRHDATFQEGLDETNYFNFSTIMTGNLLQIDPLVLVTNMRNYADMATDNIRKEHVRYTKLSQDCRLGILLWITCQLAEGYRRKYTALLADARMAVSEVEAFAVRIANVTEEEIPGLDLEDTYLEPEPTGLAAIWDSLTSKLRTGEIPVGVIIMGIVLLLVLLLPGRKRQ